MTKQSNDHRDIYDIFNDINFEEEFEPIEMNELETARFKKELREKLEKEQNINLIVNDGNIISKDKKKSRGWMKVASIAVILAVAVGFTPRGREVLAQIADKIFFNPSQGIMNEDQWGNTYVLEEPVRVDINGESTLIKNIINSGDYISIEMWTNEVIDESNPNLKEEYEEFSDIKVKELKENFRIQTLDGKYIPVEGYMMASGGYCGISFNKGKDLITDFNLYYGDEEIGHFSLKQVKYVESYDELGGNATNNGILIGATSYYLEGERYFRLWSNKDGLELPEYRMSVDSYNDIKVTDEQGNPLKFEGANDGTGKAYKLLEEYKGNIYISISDIDLNYDLREGTRTTLKLPKKGETEILNKEVKLPGLKDRAVIKAIINNNGEYENGDYVIVLDYSDNYDSNRFIYMAREGFRSGGSMGDPENKSSEIYLDKDDLSFSERLIGRVNLTLDRILIKQYGKWEFIVQ